MNEMIQTAENAEVAKFDYSVLDQDTSAFLKERANKIADISIKSIVAVGKELKAAQEKLANNKNGVFQKWVQSLGISDETAYNYIHNYEFVSKQFGNIEAAKQFLMLPKNLQYAASKPNAPAELVEGVLSGDITSHKQWKEKEAEFKEKLNAEESRRIKTEQELEQEAKLRKKAEKDLLNKQSEVIKKDKQIKDLSDQLKKAKDTGNSDEVRNLHEELDIVKKARQEADERARDLEKQLNAKPIEAQAVKVVEKVVVPEAIRSGIYDKINSLLWTLQNLSDEEMNIYLASHGSDGVVIEQTEACIRRLQTLINKANASMNEADPQHDGEGRKC